MWRRGAAEINAVALRLYEAHPTVPMRAETVERLKNNA
mgnify:FL=1